MGFVAYIFIMLVFVIVIVVFLELFNLEPCIPFEFPSNYKFSLKVQGCV